jgi:Sigma 54 modulation/S30EA ribosomal protein C terminus
MWAHTEDPKRAAGKPCCEPIVDPDLRQPIALTAARAELDVLNHRFLYLIDAEDGRGRVLYLRHDGDYGLVELQ